MNLRYVVIDTEIEPSEGHYHVVYCDGGDEWPYGYQSLEEAWRGMESWLAGRKVEHDTRETPGIEKTP